MDPADAARRYFLFCWAVLVKAQQELSEAAELARSCAARAPPREPWDVPVPSSGESEAEHDGRDEVAQALAASESWARARLRASAAKEMGARRAETRAKGPSISLAPSHGVV
jgi:hypothetical protein